MERSDKLTRLNRIILTRLYNKVERDGDTSIMSPVFCRSASNSDIPGMRFAFDKSLGHHVSVGFVTAEQKLESQIEYYTNLAEDICGIKQYLPSTEFGDSLKSLLNIGRSSTYDKIKFMVDNNIIVKYEDTNGIKMIKMAA